MPLLPILEHSTLQRRQKIFSLSLILGLYQCYLFYFVLYKSSWIVDNTVMSVGANHNQTKSNWYWTSRTVPSALQRSILAGLSLFEVIRWNVLDKKT